jgi:hypothetical protein
MIARWLVTGLAIFTLVVVGCAEKVEREGGLVITSVFDNGGQIPSVYTCDGKDISPPLTITGISDRAVSMVIVVDDPDAPLGTFVHWLMWNVKPIEKIPEGIPHGRVISEPVPAYQGKNDFGVYGYKGPCPPSGKPHTYRFKVYVLDTMLDLPSEATVSDLEKEMKGHILQFGELDGVYER